MMKKRLLCALLLLALALSLLPTVALADDANTQPVRRKNCKACLDNAKLLSS